MCMVCLFADQSKECGSWSLTGWPHSILHRNPQFGGWAYNLERGKPLNEKWSKIPGDGIDILMTHSPPAGVFNHYVYA